MLKMLSTSQWKVLTHQNRSDHFDDDNLAPSLETSFLPCSLKEVKDVVKVYIEEKQMAPRLQRDQEVVQAPVPVLMSKRWPVIGCTAAAQEHIPVLRRI